MPHPAFDAPPHIQWPFTLWFVTPCFFIGLSIIFLTTIVVPKTVRPSSLPKPAAITLALESVVPEININFLFKLNLSAKSKLTCPRIFPLFIICGKHFCHAVLR